MINKNLLKAASVVAAVAAVTAGATSANAFTIGGNVDFSVAAPAVTADFSNATVVGVDADFSAAGTPVSVQDLPLTAIVSLLASNPAIPNFITGFQYQGTNAVFDLNAGSDSVVFPTLAGDISVIDFDFGGLIKSTTGDLLATATGSFSGIETATNNDFSVDLAATEVPTPALLPALLGMGATMVRKRKQQSEVAA